MHGKPLTSNTVILFRWWRMNWSILCRQCHQFWFKFRILAAKWSMERLNTREYLCLSLEFTQKTNLKVLEFEVIALAFLVKVWLILLCKVFPFTNLLFYSTWGTRWFHKFRNFFNLVRFLISRNMENYYKKHSYNCECCT